MKINSILLTTLAAIGMAHMASADATINITGATAFRSAATTAIINSFTSVQFGYAGTASAGVTGANQQLFVGSFPGIGGTTTVRTFWSGSTEGARDVILEVNTPARFLDPTATTISASPGTHNPAPVLQNGIAKMYFTDCGVENTAYSASPNAAGLQPADSRIGAIVFTFIKNEMAAANPKFASYQAFTNVSSQQFRALFNPTFGGRSLLSQFTGNNADDDTFVYATGRNDLSGTRTIYMLETGYGAPNLVSQWKVTATASNNISEITLWPLGDVVGSVDNRSLQWNTDLPGNGGYFSGGSLRDVLDDTSNNVTVKNFDGEVIGTNQNLIFVTWLGNGDATTATANGAVALTYNGVGITPANPLSAADIAKIQNGSYTAWSFERFYRLSDAKTTVDERTLFNTVFGNIGANIGSSGLSMTQMTGVDRATDGATVLITPP
jgi:hypothetical protein